MEDPQALRSRAVCVRELRAYNPKKSRTQTRTAASVSPSTRPAASTIRRREIVRTCSVIAHEACGSSRAGIGTWFGQPRILDPGLGIA